MSIPGVWQRPQFRSDYGIRGPDFATVYYISAEGSALNLA